MGSGKILVQVDASGFTTPGVLDGTVNISSGGVSGSPLAVRIQTKVYGSGTTKAPFGYFDTPANGASSLAGNIPVTGWALDDIAVRKVEIRRDRIGAEPADQKGMVYIGDAVFVPHARPDVTGAYSDAPQAYRGGWGYMMLTNFLPGTTGQLGNGNYRIHAVAIDEEGKETILGSKTIAVDNAHSTKPFGTLDTPAPGETTSGAAYVNFGWALTPLPASIPTTGSTLAVYVDGVMLGRPNYNHYRPDIANLFPGYANSTGAVGFFHLDTTKLSDGMHSIAWSVTDSAGRVDGIGSRYFFVENGSASQVSLSYLPEASEQKMEMVDRAASLLDATEPIASASRVLYRIGHSDQSEWHPIGSSGDGELMAVEAADLQRVEIRLPAIPEGGRWRAAALSGGETLELPVGSTFHPESGVLAWQPGPGFRGRFVLAFESEGGVRIVVPVLIGSGGTEQPAGSLTDTGGSHDTFGGLTNQIR